MCLHVWLNYSDEIMTQGGLKWNAIYIYICIYMIQNVWDHWTLSWSWDSITWYNILFVFTWLKQALSCVFVHITTFPSLKLWPQVGSNKKCNVKCESSNMSGIIDSPHEDETSYYISSFMYSLGWKLAAFCMFIHIWLNYS